jgi:hypothetical protein
MKDDSIKAQYCNCADHEKQSFWSVQNHGKVTIF